MDLSDIKVVSFDLVELEDVEMPHMLYKYRTWKEGNEFNDNVLIKNHLYLSAPTDFEDELDCKIPTRYDLMSHEDTLRWCEIFARREHPRFNDEAIRREVEQALKRLPFKDNEKMLAFEIDEWKSYNDNAGVLSLCVNPLNDRMWDMYSNNNRGICYGFNTLGLVKACRPAAGGYVTYDDNLPEISPLMDVMLQSFFRAHFKLKKWEFEQEYRIRTFRNTNRIKSNRIVTYDDEALKEVIIGKDFNQALLPELIEILRTKQTDITLYQCLTYDNALALSEIPY